MFQEAKRAAEGGMTEEIQTWRLMKPEQRQSWTTGSLRVLENVAAGAHQVPSLEERNSDTHLTWGWTRDVDVERV